MSETGNAGNIARADAYAIIDTERNYQDVKFPDGASVFQYLELITKYVERAKAAIRDPGSDEYDVVMQNVRKIGGVAVRAIETWGAPMRPITGYIDKPPEEADDGN
jgi:hypothetical protein